MSEELGIRTKRSENFSKWYLEAVRKGGFVDQRSPVKGFDVILPWGYSVWELIHKRFDEEIKKNGVKNCYFPSFTPERFIRKEEEHLEGFKAELMLVTEAGGSKLEENLVVRPTSETIMYPMFSLWIRSHADLPFKINQWCNMIRYDTKVTRPFIRSRENLWQEAHTAHASREDAEKQAEEAVRIYSKSYEQMALAALVLVRPKSDTFPGADFTVVFDTPVQNGKVVQGPGTHFLGQNFSKPFDIQFTDKDRTKKYVWQTCWGMTTRQVGIILMHFGDDKGAVLPPEVAPYQVVVVPIPFKGKEDRVKTKSQEVENAVKKMGIRAFLDGRDYSPGFKFNEWELKGVPLRIEIGPRDIENREVTIVERLTGKKSKLKVSKLADLKKILKKIQKDMLAKSELILKNSITDVTDLDKLGTVSGFARANWCGSASCEEQIKETGAEIRGTLYGKKEKVFGKCIKCGKPAKHVVYIARAY